MDPLLVKKNGNLASGGGLGRGYRERERKKERKKERTGRERERERERDLLIYIVFLRDPMIRTNAAMCGDMMHKEGTG